MPVPPRIRSFAAQAVPDNAGRPRVPLPSWLLPPGLVLLAVSLFSYVQQARYHPLSGLDLQMYRGGIGAFWAGQPVYELGYTALGLPYTYPPITLLFLTPLGWTNAAHALYGMVAVSIAATVATLWCTTRILRYSGWAGRLGLAAAVTALAIWCEPFQADFNLGQINVLLMLLVAADLALADRNPAKGVLIGVATAAKLLPGLFVVYLLLTRRVRAAAVATGTFAVLTAAGWLVSPRGASDYWIKGLAFDPHRVLMALGPRYGGNQSLQGFTARLLLHTDQPSSPLWMLLALLVAVAGMALAVWAQRRGEEAVGMLVTAVTALLISPVSWSHYWLWIAPMVLVLADITRRARGPAQVVASGVTALSILPFLMWPLRATSSGPLVPNGIIWVANRHPGIVASLGEDVYVLTALGLFVLAALWLRYVRPVQPDPHAGYDPTSSGRRTRSRSRIHSASTPSRQVIFLPSSRDRAR
jgi:alpha-1,2-mannosyltransferase